MFGHDMTDLSKDQAADIERRTGILFQQGALFSSLSVIDNVAGLFGARYAGASGWGVLGAAVGGLIGLVFGLLGAVVGTAVGAILVEYVRNPDFRRAARAGAGSLLGFLVGAIAKSLLTIVMVVLALYAFFS